MSERRRRRLREEVQNKMLMMAGAKEDDIRSTLIIRPSPMAFPSCDMRAYGREPNWWCSIFEWGDRQTATLISHTGERNRDAQKKKKKGRRRKPNWCVSVRRVGDFKETTYLLLLNSSKYLYLHHTNPQVILERRRR